MTFEDANLAEDMVGKDVNVLKRKETRTHPLVVGKEDNFQLPEELRIKHTELAADIIYIENQAFINLIDWRIKFHGLAPLGTQRKVTELELMEIMEKVIHQFNQRDISITYLHLDNEVRSLKVTCKKCWKLKINFAAPDEHVPDIERTNRTLHERFQVKYHRMQYTQITRKMITYVDMKITSNMHMFLATNGASKHYSPHMIVDGKVLAFNKHLNHLVNIVRLKL